MSDRVRVLRLVEYEGPREWVEETIGRAIHGRKQIGRIDGETVYVTAVTLDEFPRVLEEARTKVVVDVIRP